jgi:AcrR family transcriptional regulator
MTTTTTTTRSTRSSRRRRTPKTRWGDREGRRRDILAAARRLLEREGYQRLDMRSVARGARVSPGTVYTYFPGREALFAALYAERLDRLHDEIADACARAASAEDLFVEVADHYLDVYRVFGRELNALTLLHGTRRLPPEVAQPVIAAATRVMTTVGAAIERLSARHGLTLADPAQRALAVPFLWATLNGLADHFTGERHSLHAERWDEVVRFAARTLVAGLARPRKES